MTTKSRNDRNGSRRRSLRNRLKAMGLPCALCGAPIDYSLPAGDPLSFEVDEIVPVSLGGNELEWSNLQPAHRLCNQRKGNRIGFTCSPPTAEDAAAARAGKGKAAQSEKSPPTTVPQVTPSRDWSR